MPTFRGSKHGKDQQLPGSIGPRSTPAARQPAAERALPPAQVALAWLLGRPGVNAPIIGATKTSHLDDAIAAVDVTLTEEETVQMESPYRLHGVLGHS
jgi:aryl-alcohol dehydrogenase-like predicted oxidoreductase